MILLHVLSNSNGSKEVRTAK